MPWLTIIRKDKCYFWEGQVDFLAYLDKWQFSPISSHGRVSQCAPKLSQGAPSLSQGTLKVFQDAHIVTATSSIKQLQALATGRPMCIIQILILARSTLSSGT